jgi:Na+/melibiose symporter-like transporter
MDAKRTVPRTVASAYAVGSVGTGVYSTVPGILLLYFMTQQLGLPVAMASSAVLAPKIIIVVLDPLIGAWSDGSTARWGRRFPFLLAGAFANAMAFVALFHAPVLGTPVTTCVVVSCLYFLAAVSYSVFAVPYVALPAEMSDDPEERARIIGWRMIFVFAGVLLGAALPPLLIAYLGGGRAGYGNMAWVVAAVSLVAMLASAWASRRVQLDGGRTATGSFRLDLVAVLRDRSYVLALLFYLEAICAAAVFTAAAPYYVRFALDRPESVLSVFFAVQVAASLLTMTVWVWVSSSIGTVAGLRAALAISAAGVLFLLVETPGGLPATVVAGVALAGVGAAGVQVCAFALLADIIRANGARSGRSREGLMTGVWLAAEKVGLAMGPFVCGMILAVGGFESGVHRGALADAAIAATRQAITLGPIALIAVAVGQLFLLGRALARISPDPTLTATPVPHTPSSERLP